MKNYKKNHPDLKFLASPVFAASVYLLRNLKGAHCTYENNTRVVIFNNESHVKIEFGDQSLKKVKFLEGDGAQIDLIKFLMKTYMKDHYLKDKIERKKWWLEHQLLHQSI